MHSEKNEKIAVLGLSFPFRGGIAHYSTLLVRELRKRYNVKFVTLNRQYPSILFPGKTQYDTSAKQLIEQNDPVIDSINPLSWIKTAFFLKKQNVDVVVVQWWNPFFGFAFGTIVNLLSVISKAKICFLCHNVVPHESTRFDKFLSQYAFLRVRYFIVHSEDDKRNLKSIKPKAIVRKTFHPTYSVFGESVIYEKEEGRSKLNISHKKHVLLFFGLIRQYKGLQYLIHAMKLVREHMDCTLLIVGECYERKEAYTGLIKELFLENDIILIDKYVRNEDVSLYFCSADVVVLPYIEATQSGIVQIAFSLKRPVITTNVGGLPEAVEHGKTGLIVAARSAERLAEAIVEYYREGCEERFCEEIKKRDDMFSWEREANEIMTLVEA